MCGETKIKNFWKRAKIKLVEKIKSTLRGIWYFIRYSKWTYLVIGIACIIFAYWGLVNDSDKNIIIGFVLTAISLIVPVVLWLIDRQERKENLY